MLQAERQQAILSLLEQQGIVNANALSKDLRASLSTIRRDLYELETMGKLTRTHGGAISNTYGLSTEPSISIKNECHTDEKKRIAQAASSLIRPGDTVILDSSTTVNAMVNYMTSTPNITVINNDLFNVNKLYMCPNVDLITIGGLLRKGSYTHIGYLCEKALEDIHADKVFLGVDALNPKSGLMICAQEGTRQKKLMVNAASEVIVVCDHSKFYGKALISFCKLDEVSCIITGTEARECPALPDIRSMGIEVMLV